MFGPSSPDAVHDKSTDVCVMFDEDRFVVRAGGVVSLCVACLVVNV